MASHTVLYVDKISSHDVPPLDATPAKTFGFLNTPQ